MTSTASRSTATASSSSSERAGRASRRELPRHWLRVEIDEEGWTHEPRLVLRHGREAVRFGDAVPAGERAALARKIRGMLASH